jgi:putative addiction module component (TIGR02574 family)
MSAAPLSLQSVALACYLFLMNERIKKLTEEASLLPPIDRAELVEGILQSLDATDPNLDQSWAEEAKDRLAAYRRSELDALDFEPPISPLSRASA